MRNNFASTPSSFAFCSEPDASNAFLTEVRIVTKHGLVLLNKLNVHLLNYACLFKQEQEHHITPKISAKISETPFEVHKWGASALQ